jgi:hypothetical protein
VHSFRRHSPMWANRSLKRRANFENNVAQGPQAVGCAASDRVTTGGFFFDLRDLRRTAIASRLTRPIRSSQPIPTAGRS